MFRKAALLASLVMLVSYHVCCAQSTGEVVFQDGDHVNFIGNSITHAGEFHNFIMLYYATRFPEANVTFYNSGIWGDNANSFLRRMDEDILDKPAGYSVVMAGMNDVNRALYSEENQGDPDIETKKERAISDYRSYMETVIQRLLAANTEVILQKPSIYDQTGDLPAQNMYGVNDALKQCADVIDELAIEYNLKTVDYWSILNTLNQQIQVGNPQATLISNDRIHPGTPGNFIMAYQFLKQTGAPRTVGSIRIDAATLKPCKNCSIENFQASDSLISFSYLANSLPFPVAPEASSALELVPFMQELNAETLKVKALPVGEYALIIDDVFIANYSHEDLATGVNLALEKNTPQYKQAEQVREQTVFFRSLQRKLRDIRRVEINYLPDSVKHGTFEDIETYIETLKNTNDLKYTHNKNLFDSYLINKPAESTIEQQLANVKNEIYLINQPVARQFRLLAGSMADPDADITHVWEFDEPVVSNKVEGWTIVNYGSPSTANGILNLTGTQTYNHIRYDVPAGNAIDPTESKTAVILLKNTTADTKARFYWWGSQATAAFIEFDVSANDTTYKEYKIDLSRDTRWEGTISVIRFDVPSPLYSPSYGKVIEIDYIKMSSEVLPEPEPEPVQPMAPLFPSPFGVNLAGAEFGDDMPGVYGSDYSYPTKEELDYFKSKGLNLIRLPFKWERIQQQLNGPLNVVELSRMKTFVTAARARGMWVLLDMHNYGRRKIDTTEYIIGDPALPVSAVADVWGKIAGEFKSGENIWGYGIMNEPHGMLHTTPWADIAQAIITEIRNVDAETTIVVAGDSWSSAERWPSASDNLKNLNDPSDNLIFEGHVYFDDDASGKYDQDYDGEGANPNIGITRTAPFVNWIKQNGFRGFIGEYGVPDDDPRWLVALDNMLAYLQENCINGTYWAAGPRWGSYRLAVEPISGVDRPQMATLELYKTANSECEGQGDYQTHIWEFDETVENNRIDGWTIVNYTNANSADGILNLTVSQTYQHIKYDVPASNVIDPSHSKYASIKLKNETPDTKARFYWWGPAGDNVANFVEFDISANDTDYQEYIVNLSENTDWTGKSSIRIIRFDLPAMASTASLGENVRVDQVKLLSSIPEIQAYTWHFEEPVVNNKVEGWNIVNYTNASTSNSVLSLTTAQTYHNIRYDVPDAEPIDPSVYKYATIKMKNGTGDSKARFYWWGPVGDNVAHFVEFDILANHSDYKEYTVELSEEASWTGKSHIRIIRFDVPSPVSQASFGNVVEIDYITLSPESPLIAQDSVLLNPMITTMPNDRAKSKLTVYKYEGENMSIGVEVPDDTQGRITVTDMFGKRLADESRYFRKGEQAVEVGIEGALPGFYVVTFYNYGRAEKISRKFVMRLQ